MIIVLKQHAPAEKVEAFCKELNGMGYEINDSVGSDTHILGLIGDTKALAESWVLANPVVETCRRVSEPYKKANRKFHPDDTIVDVGGHKMGGGYFAVMSGPCSVESKEQITYVAQRVQAAADVLAGSMDHSRVLLLAERAHITDGRYAHFRVAADAADSAALLIYAEEERDFCIGLRVLQQRDSLFAVFKILRKIYDAADRILLQRFFRRLACYGSSIDVRDGLRRYKEQLPKLFVVRHGIQQRLRCLSGSRDCHVIWYLRMILIFRILLRLLVWIFRLRGFGLSGKITLIGFFTFRFYGRWLGGKHAVCLDCLGLGRLLLFRERFPQKHADTGQQRNAEQNNKYGG